MTAKIMCAKAFNFKFVFQQSGCSTNTIIDSNLSGKVTNSFDSRLKQHFSIIKLQVVGYEIDQKIINQPTY